MKIALVSGSFDPITLGHVDIIKRSLAIFDKIVVCVLVNLEKTYLFSLEERKNLILKSISTLGFGDRIIIDSYDGLLVEYMKEKKINVIVRGIRNYLDFEYENQMAYLNCKISQNFETIFIPANPSLIHISSSVVRQIAKFGGDISEFVSSDIEQDILHKILG